MLQTTTLENLTEKVNENRKRQLCENIVKYQYFRTSAIIKIIDNAGYKEETLKAYVNSGINYITTGKKFRQYGNFYQYIDKAIAKHVQPLTPREDQKRQPHFNRYTKKLKSVPKDMDIPVVKVLNQLSSKSNITVSVNKDIKYGILNNNNIKIFDSIEDAKRFNSEINIFGCSSSKLIKIEIKEINEI